MSHLYFDEIVYYILVYECIVALYSTYFYSFIYNLYSCFTNTCLYAIGKKKTFAEAKMNTYRLEKIYGKTTRLDMILSSAIKPSR